MLYVNPLENLHTSTLDPQKFKAAKEELALKELEQHFAFILLREMRKTAPPDALLGGGQANQIYTEMLDDSLAKAWADAGQLNIAAQIAQQLRQQEKSMELLSGNANAASAQATVK